MAASTVLPRPWPNGRPTTSWPKRCLATWPNPTNLRWGPVPYKTPAVSSSWGWFIHGLYMVYTTTTNCDPLQLGDFVNTKLTCLLHGIVIRTMTQEMGGGFLEVVFRCFQRNPYFQAHPDTDKHDGELLAMQFRIIIRLHIL